MNQVVCFMSCRNTAALFLRYHFNMMSEGFSPRVGMVRLLYVIHSLVDHLVTSTILCQQWDLDTGKMARRFVAHAAQLAALAVRPLGSDYPNIPLQFSQIKTDNGRPGKLSHSTTGDETLSHSGVPAGRRSYVDASRFIVHMIL